MSIKTFLVSLTVGIIVVGILTLFLNRPNSQLSNPFPVPTEKIQPSETFIQYSDPSGFTFSYPDNLSISKNEVDEETYADLQLFSSEVDGSLSLKIMDSNYKSLNEWANLNKGESKEVNLGILKAEEIRTSDRLLLGALDQGILFSIEMPLIEEDFWIKVYDKVLLSFSFEAPSENASSTSDEVIFEGEEVVE